MCRICGRVVKCIFDTMPSRTFQVPSRRYCLSDRDYHCNITADLERRAFSTLRRTPFLPQRHSMTPALRPQSQIRTLSSPFSALSLCSQPRLTQVTRTSTPSLAASIGQSRSFSASATASAPRNTYNPSRKVQKRRSGFLARARSHNGQKLLKRRMAKGRKYLSH